MKIFSSLLLVAGTGVLFLCCQKNKEPESTEVANFSSLTAAPWVHESFGIDLDKNGSLDYSVSSLVPPCRLDNVLTFKNDNTAIADEGATKCNSADPKTTMFNWNFANNETNLTISGNVFQELNGTFKIGKLTKTSLSLSKDTTVAGFGNVSVVVNLKH